WPASEKANYLQRTSKELLSTRKQTKSNLEELNKIVETDISESFVQPPKQETILNWYTKPISSAQSEKLHSKLLDALIYDNIPFNLV
ncbi:17282_t:CDS:1, partial [Cetraspora pellucida]